MRIPLLSVVLVGLLLSQLPPADEWSKADSRTQRLVPSAFQNLPPAVRAELERRGCTIPQTYLNRTPHNVIRGEFSRAGQIDWAALCSHERVSSIVVFRGGDPKDVAEIAVRPDADFLQTVTADQIGFSRAISAASPEYIREHHRRYGGPTPPSLPHAGINDAFVGKGSSVWYWHEGRWLPLTGAD